MNHSVLHLRRSSTALQAEPPTPTPPRGEGRVERGVTQVATFPPPSAPSQVLAF